MIVEKRLKELGLELPEVPKPVANYLPCVRVGNVLYLGGTVGIYNGVLKHQGKVGAEVSLAEAYESARLCCLNHLATIKAELGDLDRVERIVKVVGYVASAPGFVDQPAVINGQSDLLVELYGERGRHTRLALGISEIGLHAPVETEMTVLVSD